MNVYVWILISFTTTSGGFISQTQLAVVPTLKECNRVATLIKRDEMFSPYYTKLRCIQVLKP